MKLIRYAILIILICHCSSLESELVAVRQEKESLTQQLLNTIKHKVALSQELDAWQVGLRLQEHDKYPNNPLVEARG